MTTSRLFAPFFLAVLSALFVAFAQPAYAQSEADKAAAEALFDQARSLMQQGNFEPACEKLRTSQELDPAVGTLLYLGDCYEKANRLASAFRAFERAQADAEEANDSRAQLAAVRASALKPRLLSVIVEVQGAPPQGLVVRASGRAVSPEEFGVATPVDEGPLLVVASAPGFDNVEIEVQIMRGAKEPYRVVIPEFVEKRPTAAAAPPVQPSPTPVDRPETPSNDGSGQRMAAYIVGGVGVASLIVGGVFAGLAKGKNDDSLAECSSQDPTRCNPTGKSLRDDAVSQASIATVAGIVGGIGLAAGVTLYVTAPSGSDRDSGFSIAYQGAF